MRKTNEGTPITLRAKEGSKQRCRQKCKALTKAGAVCHAPAVEKGFCFFHAHPEKSAELGRLGGRKNRRWRSEDLDGPPRSLKTVKEVVNLLDETINRLWQGPFDLRTANTIGFLTGILLKALAQQAEVPETTDSERSPGVYTALFARLRTSAPGADPSSSQEPTGPPEGVFPLYPESAVEHQAAYPIFPELPKPAISSEPTPTAGESVDDPSTPPKNRSQVITVDVG